MGLRGRLVVAMLLVSALTLGVAALALFAPLTKQLQDDEVNGMIRAAHAERHVFAALEGVVLPSQRTALRSIAGALRRGSGADVAVIGPGGRLLYNTDADNHTVTPQALTALRTRGIQRGRIGEEALVAVPLRLGSMPIAVELRRSRAGIDGAVRVVRDAFLLAAGIGLGVALLVGLVVARGLVSRLRALRDTALRVAKIGPVVEIRSDGTRDEVGDLTRALVDMQERLREQEQARRTFVATASHELRTPLTSLTLMLDTLRRDLEDPPDMEGARRLASGAEAQAERLAGLAGELLDLSRLDAGLPQRSERVDTAEILRSVLAEFGERTAGRAPIALTGDTAPVQGDPGSVAQIMRVLIDNALEHGQGCDVAIVTECDAATVRVAVRDQGPGVEDVERERIFERFERGAQASAVPGFGLGLSIARELARRMDGDLSVQEPDGEPGACFRLALPRARATEPAD